MNNLICDQFYVFNRSIHIKTVSTTLFDKIEELSSYRRDYHKNASEGIYEAMLSVARDNNLFDSSVYTTYLEIKLLLDKLSFINIVLKQSSGGGYRSETFTKEETHTILVDMFKYHKQRVNLDNYKISLNPVVVDTTVEEEDDPEEQEDLIEEEELVEEFV
jgi:hypothetical protein